MRTTTLLLCLAGTLSAQDLPYTLKTGGIAVGGMFGLIQQPQAFGDTGYKPHVGLTVMFGLNRHLSGGLRFTGGPYNNDVGLNGQVFSFKSTISAGIGEVKYAFNNKKISPFIVGGVGGLQFKNISTNATTAFFRNDIIQGLSLTTGWQTAYDIGGGVDLNFTRNFGMDLSFRLLKGQRTFWFYQPAVGIYYRFQ